MTQEEGREPAGLPGYVLARMETDQGWRALRAGLGLICGVWPSLWWLCEEGVWWGAQGEAGEQAGRHVLGPSEVESSDGGLHRTFAATGALALALAMLHSVGRQRLSPCALLPSSPTTELD